MITKRSEFVKELKESLNDLETLIFFLDTEEQGETCSEDDTVANHVGIYFSTLRDLNYTMDKLIEKYGKETLTEFLKGQYEEDAEE